MAEGRSELNSDDQSADGQNADNQNPDEQNEDRIPVGYVRKAHGIRGDVVVRGLVDDARERFVPGASFLTNEADAQMLTIHRVTPMQNDFRISFVEVSDRNRSEDLKGTQITLPASERRALEDGEWWPEDLVGCNVMSIDGGKIGIVHEVIIGAAQDRLVVIAPDGSKGAVPFVEALVPRVDIANDEIIVDLPDGLFE